MTKELSIIDRILGPIVFTTSLNKNKRITYKEQVLGFIREIICVKKEREIGFKLIRGKIKEDGSGGSKGGGGTIWDHIVSILLIRNARKYSQVTVVASLQSETAGLSINCIK